MKELDLSCEARIWIAGTTICKFLLVHLTFSRVVPWIIGWPTNGSDARPSFVCPDVPPLPFFLFFFFMRSEKLSFSMIRDREELWRVEGVGLKTVSEPRPNIHETRLFPLGHCSHRQHCCSMRRSRYSVSRSLLTVNRDLDIFYLYPETREKFVC